MQILETHLIDDHDVDDLYDDYPIHINAGRTCGLNSKTFNILSESEWMTGLQ